MQRNRKQECILLSGRIFMVNFTWLIALNSLFNTKKKNKEEFNESKSTRKKKNLPIRIKWKIGVDQRRLMCNNERVETLHLAQLFAQSE